MAGQANNPKTPLADPRKEAYCQFRARGLTREAAYHEAGYNGTRSNAARLEGRQYIFDRIQSIMTALWLPLAGPEMVIKGLVKEAMTAPESSSRIRALEALARVYRMFVDRSEVSTHEEVDDEALAKAAFPSD